VVTNVRREFSCRPLDDCVRISGRYLTLGCLHYRPPDSGQLHWENFN